MAACAPATRLALGRLAGGLAAAGGVLASVPAAAQAVWRSTLYPTGWTPPGTLRFESDLLLQDFSYAGYRRGEAALPAPSGPVFDVTAYGADASGVADSTVAIQSAINAATAADGGVVYLPAGTFRVSPQGANAYALRIAASNIVLRGAGRSHTFLFNDSALMRSKAILRVDGSGASWSSVPAGSPQPLVTQDLPSPTRTIPVASVAGFVVGDWVVIRADATDAFVAEHNMTDLWAGQAAGLGGVMFLRQVTAIDATAQALVVDAPIRYYLKTRDNARVHKAVPHVQEVGLEDFSIGNREHPSSGVSTGWGENDYTVSGTGAWDAHDSWAVAFRRARDCWMARVGTYRPAANTLRNSHILSNGVLLENCRGVTLADCDFQRPLYGGGGGNGYQYRLHRANECLLRDCAARHNRHGFVFSGMACSGNVIHGGIAQVTRVQAAGTGATSGEGCDHHMHLSQSNLVDGVQLDRDFFTAHYRGTNGSAPQHGQTSVHSVFWNLVGLAYQSNKSFIVRSEQARRGYVIGTRGPASGVTLTSLLDFSGRTAPQDHSEGAGQGATLEPLSLYHDQLQRRLGVLPVPPKPVGLAATAGSGQVTLSWHASSTATTYDVKRATAPGGPYGTVASVTGTTHVDGGLAGGTPVYYVVSARNASGGSGDSTEVAATPLAAAPMAPGNLTAVAVSATQVNLAWSDNSGNETGFRIERSTKATSGFTQVGTVGANVTTFASTGLKSRVTYYFRVRAYNASGNSAYSATVSARTP